MKQWIDMVPEHNWAYGKKGTALQDKIIFRNYVPGDKENGW
jgi:glutathione-regulated potassium-efflux system ancillary protein KefG